MNRVPILACGAVLASFVLCGGAVAVADALTSAPVSNVLSIGGVSTTPSATPVVAADPTAADPTATPSPSASATPDPGDDNGVDDNGVTVVKPPDPTRIGGKAKIDGKGCAHLGKSASPVDHGVSKTGVPQTVDGAHHYDGHGIVTGTPVPRDPDTSAYPSDLSSSPTSGSRDGTDGGLPPGWPHW